MPKHLQGVFFKDAEPVVLKDLKTRNLVYKILNYTHSYPHCYRCGTPLFYNALPAWFINIQKIKPRLRQLNAQQMQWYPEYLKAGRFDKSVESAPDWNISRNRYWATALPFWKCQNKECKHVACIGSISELIERSINFKEVYPDFTPTTPSADAAAPPQQGGQASDYAKASSDEPRLPAVALARREPLLQIFGGVPRDSGGGV